MTNSDVFQALLQRLATDKEGTIGWEEVRHWPKSMADALCGAGLLKPSTPATAVECPGCHGQCVMPVHVAPAQNGLPGRAFVACDRRDDIGRVKINLTRLGQWQCSRAQLAMWLARELGIKGKPVLEKATGVYQLGSVQGKKRLGLLELAFADGVVLRVAGHGLPLLEALDFAGEFPIIDLAAVQDAVDLPPVKETTPRYAPSTARREARKLDTQAMYQAWQKAYRKLKKDKPNRSDVWYAKQIGKMEIAQGRETETIRRHMKRP